MEDLSAFSAIAHCYRLDETLERRHQPRVPGRNRLAPAALAPPATGRQRLAVEIVRAAIDGRAG